MVVTEASVWSSGTIYILSSHQAYIVYIYMLILIYIYVYVYVYIYVYIYIYIFINNYIIAYSIISHHIILYYVISYYIISHHIYICILLNFASSGVAGETGFLGMCMFFMVVWQLKMRVPVLKGFKTT